MSIAKQWQSHKIYFIIDANLCAKGRTNPQMFDNRSKILRRYYNKPYLLYFQLSCRSSIQLTFSHFLKTETTLMT